MRAAPTRLASFKRRRRAIETMSSVCIRNESRLLPAKGGNGRPNGTPVRFAGHGAPPDQRPSLVDPTRDERIGRQITARREHRTPSRRADEDEIVAPARPITGSAGRGHERAPRFRRPSIGRRAPCRAHRAGHAHPACRPAARPTGRRARPSSSQVTWTAPICARLRQARREHRRRLGLLLQNFDRQLGHLRHRRQVHHRGVGARQPHQHAGCQRRGEEARRQPSGRTEGRWSAGHACPHR